MNELCVRLQVTLRIAGPSRSVPRCIQVILEEHVMNPEHWDVEDIRIASITATRTQFENNTMTCFLSITIHYDRGMSTTEAIDHLEDSLWNDRPFWRASFHRGHEKMTDIEGFYFHSASYKIRLEE